MTIILEVGIGIVLVFVLLSLVTSTLTEWVATVLALRSKTLETGIRELLNDPRGTGLAKAIYEHPLVNGLYRNGSKPSYIPAAAFARALMDLVVPKSVGPTPAALDQLRDAVSGLQDTSLKTAVLALAMALATNPPLASGAETGTGPAAAAPDDLRMAIAAVDNPDVKRALLTLIEQPAGSVTNLLPNLEQWFNSAMDRVSGWYKRQAQLMTIAIALLIGLLLNADTLMIADGLARDPTVRAAAVAAAQQTASKGQSTQPTLDIAEFQKEAAQLQLPIGWSAQAGDARSLPNDLTGWLRKLLGIALTVVAISLGAPFWFELLY